MRRSHSRLRRWTGIGKLGRAGRSCRRDGKCLRPHPRRASALVEVLRAPYKEYRQRTARINALRVLAKLASRERGARYKSKLSAASLDL